MKDFDAKRILQRPFFQDLNLPLVDDEKILATFDVSTLNDSAAIEKKLADLHALDDKLKAYRRLVKENISALKDKIVEQATEGADVEDDAALLRQLNFIDDRAEIFNLGFGRLFVNIEKILDMQYRKEFGAGLKAARQAKGLTQTDVARLIHVTPSTLSQYESGLIEPTIRTLKRLADTLNVSADYLLGLTENFKGD